MFIGGVKRRLAATVGSYEDEKEVVRLCNAVWLCFCNIYYLQVMNSTCRLPSSMVVLYTILCYNVFELKTI